MKTLFNHGLLTLLTVFIFSLETNAQTKKLKRPSSRVGVSSVDKFVRESFDLYDKVYMYDGYAKAGTPLSDDDIDVLEQALDDVTGLSDSAPNILSDIEGIGVLKQSKATLQINRAKKALKYSIKTAKELLLNNRNAEKEEETPTSSDEENNSKDRETVNNSNDVCKVEDGNIRRTNDSGQNISLDELKPDIDSKSCQNANGNITGSDDRGQNESPKESKPDIDLKNCPNTKRKNTKKSNNRKRK